jgi:hypothetical protein
MNIDIFESVFQEEVYSLKPKLVIVIENSWQSLSEQEREQLKKIIGALKISFESIQIAIQSDFKISSFEHRTNKLIYFGSTPGNFANYQQHTFSGISFICSEALSQLLINESTRKQLWTGLKNMFAAS